MKRFFLFFLLISTFQLSGWAASHEAETIEQLQDYLQEARENLNRDHAEAAEKVQKAADLLSNERHHSQSPRSRKVLKAAIRQLERLANRLERSNTDVGQIFELDAKQAEEALRVNFR